MIGTGTRPRLGPPGHAIFIIDHDDIVKAEGVDLRSDRPSVDLVTVV